MKNTLDSPWYPITNVDVIHSPTVLVYPERISANLAMMIAGAGGDASKLRPHVKTHKMAEVIHLKLDAGITKFKTSTIAETEMTLEAGGSDVLLAYQPVGPNIGRLIQLMRRYSDATIATVVDDLTTARRIASSARDAGVIVPLYVDLNIGMNRTGVFPNEQAEQLYHKIANTPGVKAAGLHAYDGHLHDTNFDELKRKTTDTFAPVWTLKQRLEEANLSVPKVIASGTPTSDLLATRADVEVGAGTTVLWDAGQPRSCPTLRYKHAAVVLTRVVSRPQDDLICIDLGHKAIASEFEPPRVLLFGLENAVAVSHSEEHMVLKTDKASSLPPGTELYGLPYHICPTIALHQDVWCVRDHVATQRWPVTARNRYLTV